MPKNLGTSRKGKPGKNERAVGLGKALIKSQGHRYRPRSDGKNRTGEGGMAMQPGVESIGVDPQLGGLDQEHGTRSVLELHDLDDFLLQADLANREFLTEREGLVILDASGQALQSIHPGGSMPEHGQPADNFVFTELSVPRRPEWDRNTTPSQLDAQEKESFLNWRRAIASREEYLLRTQSSAQVTPYEKNLEVWRQLWRVLERCSCLLQLVDARNPLFYLSDDLRQYATTELGKPMMVLVNKSDYLSTAQRQAWHDFLVHERGWDRQAVLFFSAHTEQQKLDAAAQKERRRQQRRLVVASPSKDEDVADGSEDESDLESTRSDGDRVESDIDPAVDEDDQDLEDEDDQDQEEVLSADGCGIDVPLTRRQLMEAMLAFARRTDCQPDPRFDNRIQFGMVGFPNVGKSSVINVLVGSSKHAHGVVRVGVASQPGKTKHFQTLFMADMPEMMLCDCPGLVFPSFVSNTADLIAAGVYPIAQMRDHWPVITLICQRIPREIINAYYGIHLPVPSEQELRERGLRHVPPPSAEELLSTYCIARGMLAASSGVPDYPRSARMVIKDYAEGKLLYCHPPPSTEDPSAFYRETVSTALANADKLRQRLEKQQQAALAKKVGGLPAHANVVDGQRDDEELDDDGNALDDDILELVLGGGKGGELSSSQAVKTQQRKWGKKNKKNRNKDPYGCHATPDEMLQQTGSLSGVIVNAGKHGRKGYTRPIGYGGVRAATATAGIGDR